MAVFEFLKCSDIPPETGKTVAIIGAGPAGLSAAGYLVCMGHSVVVYDSNPEPGGIMVFGIPDSRLPKDMVRESIKRLEGTGRVRFVLNTTVGRHVSLEELISSYDAVIIATGAWRTRRLGVEGENLDGVYGALEWIVDYMREKLGYKPVFHKRTPKLVEPVAVIGAGYTALDVVLLVAFELGLKTLMVYRRTRRDAPIGESEVFRLERRGVAFLERLAPFKFEPGEDGRVARILCYRTKPGPPDESGRQSFTIDTSEVVAIEARTVMLAVGLTPTPPFDVEKHGIKVSKDGRILTDSKYRTSREKVFAAGDVRDGAVNIAHAMQSGLEAAKRVHEYLTGKMAWSD